MLAGEGEDRGGLLAAHELGGSEVQWVAAAMSSQGASAELYVALAPMTWKAGRAPSGRIGSTLADVWTPSRRTIRDVSIP